MCLIQPRKGDSPFYRVFGHIPSSHAEKNFILLGWGKGSMVEGKHLWIAGWCWTTLVSPFNSPMLSVHSELAYIGFITSWATSVKSFESLCVSYDICAVTVFNFCHLWLPLCITSATCVLVSENVFRKTVNKICRLCLTRWKLFMVLPKEWLIQ